MTAITLPPVERVRPGLWSVPVPLPNSSLRYVLVYVFETDRGPYLVDAGWNTDEAYAALEAGLGEMGCGVKDVAGVLVTHIHPDHYGLAGRIREASGAWIGLHEADARLIHDRYDEPDGLIKRMGEELRRFGAPAEEAEKLKAAAMPVRPMVDAVRPDVLIADGQKPEVPGWDLSAIWTPGHSPGHLCFWEDRNRLMLAGDHILPRITPNISFHPQAGPNPLGDFLDSLDKLTAYDPDEVLPAHEHRFVGLRNRIDELKAHHETRFGEVLDALDGGLTTAWQIAERMHWSRPWDRIEGFMRRAAVAEAMAHLTMLERRGQVIAEPGEPTVWRRSDGRPVDHAHADHDHDHDHDGGGHAHDGHDHPHVHPHTH